MAEVESKEVAVVEQNQAKGVSAKFSADDLAKSDINNGAMIPETAMVKALPVKLNEEFWNPEVGEVKDFVVLEFGIRQMPSLVPEKNGALEDVKVASLAARGANKDGTPKLERWAISAKRAVSVIEEAVKRGYLIPGNAKTMIRLTYTGEVKNKNNMFKSKNFDAEVIINA